MKIALAPIHGMTLSHYRNEYDKYFGNIDTYYAPFIATTHMRKKSSTIFKDILLENNSKSIDLIPQLIGNNPEDFNFFASVIASKGYEEINWNIGCPFPRVTNKVKGSGLLREPKTMDKFLSAIDMNKEYKVSVKLRLGYSDLLEGKEVVKVLNNYPLKNITIHARVGIQKYEGVVDLDGFEELMDLSDHELIYNGDIYTKEDYKNISERFSNIDTFMIGRGALRNPFLPSEIKGIDTPDNIKAKKIIDFHNSIYKHTEECTSAEVYLCSRMKEFWIYLSSFIDDTGSFMNQVERCRSKEEYDRLIYGVFNRL